MNKRLRTIGALWVGLILLLARPGHAQLLTDDFNATTLPYALTTAQGSWSAHSGAGTNPVQATAPTLSYGGIATAGGSATLTTSGEDVNRSFTQQSSGSVYASFLVNVNSAQAAGDYFLHLGPTNLGTTFIGRVFVKSVAGGIQFGVAKGSDAAGPVYAGATYATGTTYLLVLKYTFVGGSTTDDPVDLFVQPAVGQAEPSPVASTTSTVADLANAGTVALRQGTAASAASLRVDYLRVGTTWASVTSGSTVAPSLTANPTTLAGFNAIQGAVSTVQTYTLTGTGLPTGPVSVSASSGIELSPDGVTFGTTPLSVSATAGSATQVVYVRLGRTLGTGPFSGTITNAATSGPATLVTVQGQVSGANTPTLTVSSPALTGFTTTQGIASRAQSFSVGGRLLTPGSFTATASPGFEISQSETTGYAGQLTVSNQTDPFSVLLYVRLTASAPFGAVGGAVTITGANSTSASVALTGTVASTTGFTPIAAARASAGQTVTIQGRVTASNQLGSRQIYVQDETGGIAVYSGATGTDLTTVVQLGDLVQVRGPITVFNGFLEVNGVTSYTVVAGAGTVVPTPVTVLPEQLASYQGQLVRVVDASLSPAGATLTGGTNYTLTAGGQSAIVRISANSPLAGAGRPANPVTVTGIADRFVSGATTIGTNGLQLQPRILTDIPGATAAQDQRCTLPGESGLPVDQTFDIATWNMEFFGADAGTITCPTGTLTYSNQGPVNEDLQQTNAVAVLNKLSADIISVEEVSNEARLRTAVSSLPGNYSYVCSDKFSYFFQNECDQTPSNGTVFGPTRYAQKVCVIYNTATVTPLPAESKPLLLGKTADYTYPGAVGGNGNGSGWASGRLPYLFVANVTINGITRKLHVVGLHGKSGSTKADFDRRTQDYNDLKAELDANYPSANVVILGDYNDRATASIYTASPVSSFNSFVADAVNYNVLTRPLEQQGCSTFNSSASFIDHIIVSNDLQPAYLANSTYVLQPFSIPNYANTTSDHNPVVARFDLSKLTTPTGGALQLLMPTYNCQTGAITFRTSGGDGTAVEFFSPAITRTWTTNPSQTIDAEKRSDPNSGTIVTLQARQSGREVSLDFDFGAYCRAPGGNLPPSVNLPLPAQTGKVGQFFSYKMPGGIFSDPESQPLTLTAQGLPAGLALTPPDLRLVSGTPTQAGSFTALITAIDPQGASSTARLLIMILPANSAESPLMVAQPIADQSGRVGQPFTFRIPDATFAGPVAAIDVSDLARGLMYLSDSRTITGTVTQPDARVLTVTATDGFGGRAQTRFTLTFTNSTARLGAAPEPTLRATLLPNPVGEEFTVRVEGADGQTVRFTLTDSKGATITDRSADVTNPTHDERIRLNQRSSGLYLLRIGVGQQTITLKVVKQ